MKGVCGQVPASAIPAGMPLPTGVPAAVTPLIGALAAGGLIGLRPASGSRNALTSSGAMVGTSKTENPVSPRFQSGRLRSALLGPCGLDPRGRRIDRTVRSAASEVARAIEPSVGGRSEWVGYESLRSQLRSIEVAPACALAADIHLALNTRRERLQIFIENVGRHAGQRRAD
jgi:hypothetical protein